LALVLLLATTADAATLAETLDQFGFSGTFAARCDDAASPNNIRRVITISSRGDAEFVERFGDAYDPNVYEVMAARLRGRDTLVLAVQMGNSRQELTIRKSRGRMRTIRNLVSDGTLRVKDGKVVGTGQETAWLQRCGDSQ